MTELYPSLLSVDFLDLQHELKRLEETGVDGVYFDIVDGQFVPSISTGLPVLDAVRKGATLSIDVYLTTENPEKYIVPFTKHGADMILVHVESTPHTHCAIQMIKHLDKRADVVTSPGASISQIEPILDIVDRVSVMTVNPGSNGQSFIDQYVEKVVGFNTIRVERQLNFDIEVNGGVNTDTAEVRVKGGITILVIGSFFSRQGDCKEVTQASRGWVYTYINLLCSDWHLPQNIWAKSSEGKWGGIDRGALVLLKHQVIPFFSMGNFDSVSREEYQLLTE